MRAILIESCKDCPSLEHNGGFGQVAYIPVCGRTGRTLGYTKGVSGSRVVASYDGRIPDCCPLPEIANEAV